MVASPPSVCDDSEENGSDLIEGEKGKERGKGGRGREKESGKEEEKEEGGSKRGKKKVARKQKLTLAIRRDAIKMSRHLVTMIGIKQGMLRKIAQVRVSSLFEIEL